MVELTEEQKQIKREKHREYMRKRREDPEFNNKQRELNRIRKKYLYDNDAEYREKQKIKCKEYAKEKNNYKKLYEELLNKTQNTA